MTADELLLDARRLTDAEVRLLRDTYRNMSFDRDLSRPLQHWYAELALRLDGLLTTRVLQWATVVDAADVPPSWQDAVDTLPDDGSCR